MDCCDAMRSAQEGHADCLSLLIDAGCELEAQSSGGGTALMSAAMQGHLDCLLLLIKAGCNLDARGESRLEMTAAMWAANNGHADCLRALIDAGCDIKAADTTGKTAASRALNMNEVECLALIEAGEMKKELAKPARSGRKPRV